MCRCGTSLATFPSRLRFILFGAIAIGFMDAGIEPLSFREPGGDAWPAQAATAETRWKSPAILDARGTPRRILDPRGRAAVPGDLRVT